MSGDEILSEIIPFSCGLWVISKAKPNTTDAKNEAISWIHKEMKLNM